MLCIVTVIVSSIERKQGLQHFGEGSFVYIVEAISAISAISIDYRVYD